jgi:hypothetical protein
MIILGGTLLSLIPIKSKIFIETPAAKAEIHNPKGTKEKNMEKKMITNMKIKKAYIKDIF